MFRWTPPWWRVGWLGPHKALGLGARRCPAYPWCPPTTTTPTTSTITSTTTTTAVRALLTPLLCITNLTATFSQNINLPPPSLGISSILLQGKMIDDKGPILFLCESMASDRFCLYVCFFDLQRRTKTELVIKRCSNTFNICSERKGPQE